MEETEVSRAVAAASRSPRGWACRPVRRAFCTTRTSSRCACCPVTCLPGSHRPGTSWPSSRCSWLWGWPEPGPRSRPWSRGWSHAATSGTASRSRCGPTTNRSRRRSRPAGYAQALTRLHAGMRMINVPAPHFTDRVADVPGHVASTPALDDADRHAPQHQAAGPEPRRRRPRRPRAAAARRAAPGQRAEHNGRAAVHRPGDLLPRTGRVRPRPRARSGQRALPRCRPSAAPRLPGARPGGGGQAPL